MTLKLGVLMDPIASIHYKKDSTLSMLWEANERNWSLYYFEQKDLILRDGIVYALMRPLRVFKDEKKWFALDDAILQPLTDLDVVLMRKDPPFNVQYVYTTHLLEFAEKAGVLILNKPQSLRDANEKLFTAWFPECCPTTIVTQSIPQLKAFYAEQKDIVCKPLDAMGGSSIFHLTENDSNASVIFEVLTENGSRLTMAQRYIPEIKAGDKRILMINGEPVPYALARIPASGEFRGNLAAGGRGVTQPLSQRDKAICEKVGPLLRAKGLFFVGLDVIGDYLTEINVTSPTCIRELNEQCHLKIEAQLMDFIEHKCKNKIS